VDLTLLISEGHPTWPAHMSFQRKLWNWFVPSTIPGREWRSEVPYHTAWWTIDEHTGTHFDAPSHFVPPPETGLPEAGPAGLVTADQVPLAKLHGPACVIDCRHLVGQAEPGVSPEIDFDVIESFEREHKPIIAGEVVIFASGWDSFYRAGPEGSAYALDVVNRRVAGWPSPTPSVIEGLHAKGITTLATDGCSIGSSEDGRPGHLAGLSREMVYVEGLANLDALPPRGAYFIFLPVKVAGSSGAPGRAIGLLPSA
jgi:kynurenine formamidase